MNYITWPFYFMILDDKEITDAQSKAARDAYTDFIWELMEKERW